MAVVDEQSNNAIGYLPSNKGLNGHSNSTFTRAIENESDVKQNFYNTLDQSRRFGLVYKNEISDSSSTKLIGQLFHQDITFLGTTNSGPLFNFFLQFFH